MSWMKTCGRGWPSKWISLSVERVIQLVEQVVHWRGQPQAIRLDKGPEFIAERFITWCAERAIQLSHVHPDKSDPNTILGS